MAGMLAVMTSSMIANLTIGLMLGIALQGELITSTILAILLSMTVGFCLGKPIGLLAIIEGITAGIMGGMMGAMLGEMLPAGHFKTMLLFMDIFFTIMLSLLVIWISTEATGGISNGRVTDNGGIGNSGEICDKGKTPNNRKIAFSSIPTYYWIISIIIPAILLFLGAFLDQPAANQSVDKNYQHKH